MTFLRALVLVAAFAFLLARASDYEQYAHASGRVPAVYAGGTARPATSGRVLLPESATLPDSLLSQSRLFYKQVSDKTSHVGVWTRMADCESGDGDGHAPYTASWHYDGYHDGGLQFLPTTWNAAKRLREVRGFAARYGYAYHAPAWVQIRVADNWRRHTSWAQWPTCSRKLGLH